MAARLREDFLYLCRMNPFISIIIPFYGTADPVLLQRCLDSIHGQGMDKEDYEVIVTDDDGKGLGAARNKGMRQATGTYLMFVDADDYLLPNSIKRFSCLMKEHPDICSFRMFEVKGKVFKPLFYISLWGTYETGAEYMSSENFTGNVCRHFFRRRFLNDHDIVFTEECYHEDEDFLAKAYCWASKTIISNAYCYAYYTNPSSITRQNSLEMRLRRLADFHKMLHRMNDLLLSVEASEGPESMRTMGVRRRLNFLTIDYIRLLVRNRSPYFKEQFKMLRSEGFLPLPKNDYNWKYRMARVAINIFV